MSSPFLAEEVGCWKKERVLGSGGFGYVVLWRNKETNETIALKQCQWGHDACMTPKYRSRWKMEVDMMFRLHHPNVVKAVPVPPELDVPATELPLLAMEYCSNGDLRKELNKPENCCGLKEKQVRLFLRHVSSAVNYLHSMKIIHRDLKPENIVIQEVNGKIVHKLIDLGYAKELDQGSMCVSFVGTLQYIAPELFLSQKCSCTVDYWSFGLVTHEVMTGQRPFLPDKSPAEWIPVVKKKEPSHIRAFIDTEDDIVFSSHIAPTHSICSVLKKDVEEWLQLMLEWDPRKRGKRDKTTAFPLLEKILNKKTVLVFCVETCKLLSFATNENICVKTLQKYLENETRIPVDQQELLCPKGLKLDSVNDVNFISNLEEEEILVILFSKNIQNSIPPSINISIPSSVEAMMRNPGTTMEYLKQREAWMHAVGLSQHESVLFTRLVQAFRTNLMHLLAKTSSVHKPSMKMVGEMNKLLAKCSFFEKSLEQDLLNYEELSKSGSFASLSIYENWKASSENLKKIKILQNKFNLLESTSASIGTRTIELQRSTYARSKQSNPLEDIYHKVVDAYAQLKKRSREQRNIPHDNINMVQLMCLCLQHREDQIREIFNFIRNVSQIRREAEVLHPQLEMMLGEIASWDKQLNTWQEKRQSDMWKMMESLYNRILQRPSSIHQHLSPLSFISNESSSDSLPSLGQRNSRCSWNPPMPYCNTNALCTASSVYTMGNGIHGYIPSSPNLPTHFNSCQPSDAPLANLLPHIHNEHLVRAECHPVGSKNSSLNWSNQSGAGSPVLPDWSNLVHPSSQLSLSCLLQRSIDDSRKIKDENRVLVESLCTMMNSMKPDDLSMKSENANSISANSTKNVLE